MATKKKSKKISSIIGDVSPMRDVFMQFVGSFFGHFIDQLQEDLTERIEEGKAELKVKWELFLKNTRQAFVVFFLLTLGAIFLFFGLANVLDYLFKIKGAGFLLVGTVMTFLGLVIAIIVKK